MIRVFICDDQRIVVDGLHAILDADPELEVVGVAYDGAEALERIPEAKPDVVLMDLKMPVMDGIQATRKIHQAYPHIKVLVLTTYSADEWVFDAVRGGAAGYLLKGTPKEQVVAAVKGTAAGGTHIDPAVGGKLFAQIVQSTGQPSTFIADKLSNRELDVLRLVARGLTNTDIAQQLMLTEGTARNYVSAILEKLDVPDRTQAAIIALKHGLAD
jgi:NarL family two-component system response regulator LiaR